MTDEALARHNDQVRAVWDAYRKGHPIRVPIIFGINVRFTMDIPEANPRQITFEQYFNNPQTMLERQLEHFFWIRHHIPQDAEMGLPETGWSVSIDFQNVYEAAWFGCPIRFFPGEVPDTVPILTEDNKKALLDSGIPDPFTGGLMAKNWDFYEFFRRKQEEGWTFMGKPIATVTPCGLGTDGPMTVCCNLRGATEFLLDLKEDTDFALELLDLVTSAIMERIRAYRRHLGMEEKPKVFGFADDSIELLSLDDYRELVFPFHQRLVTELADVGASVHIHLCGDAQRHFLFLKENLGVRSIDTGFPVDLSRARRELGPEVELLGGPPVPLLRYGTSDDVRRSVTQILTSGVMEGGRFILREGNNLAPGTPLENIRTMYEVGKELGCYR